VDLGKRVLRFGVEHNISCFGLALTDPSLFKKMKSWPDRPIKESGIGRYSLLHARLYNTARNLALTAWKICLHRGTFHSGPKLCSGASSSLVS
jgi:hypothetical protein